MENYSFYIIKCKDENIIDTYIGHTNNIENRIREHSCATTNINESCYNSKIYKTIRENGGFNNWILNELFSYFCDFTESRKIEQVLIDEFKPTLNTYRAYTDEETRKLRHNETARIRRQFNLENIRNYDRHRYNNNDDYKKRKNNSNKKWKEKNESKVKKYKNEWYTNNKERLSQQYKCKKEQKLMMLEDKH